MDIAALVTAIVLDRLSAERKAARRSAGGLGPATLTMGGGSGRSGGLDGEMIRGILVDTMRSPAISALILGLALGIFARPESVYESFYEPLFRGLLSILMLIMGIEAWQRLSELRGVAHAYILYGIAAPLLHGLLGFGAGACRPSPHRLLGGGGVVLLAVMAASSSDISGPPTLRAALPEANPSAYVGTSTGLGTPIAILSIPLWIALAGAVIGI